ncbi:MAG: alcohol dehydrogenase [Oceanospirillaceae bacterium]|nr:alcohol dehydrogenase [Oceanospirillaceae bacterium]|tara:strand:+ start:17479 stop:18666 length:1188 start_codon:yes stop_codon:yes gene_type:complete
MTDHFNEDWQCYVPPVYFGPGRLDEAATLIRDRHFARVLLVTDPGIAQQTFFSRLCKSLEHNTIDYRVFSAVRGNPTSENVADCCAVFRDNDCDAIVTIGGGSAIDVAKAVSLTAANHHDLWDFCFFEDPANLPAVRGEDFFVPLLIIPTTAGTGSELSGSSCVITDCDSHRKRVPYHPEHFPFAVIDDPQLLTGLPANLSAWTGMDALTHALEAYSSPVFNPMCDGIALEAIRLCHQWLEKSVANGSDLTARSQMMAASSIAAVAFSAKGLGAVHSLAHAIGALFDTHHGLANAVVLPYMLEHNKEALADKLTTIACLLNLPEKSPDGVIQWLLALRQSLNIPSTLADLNIAESDLQAIAELALKDAEHQTNPVSMDENAFMQVCHKALHGRIG